MTFNIRLTPDEIQLSQEDALDLFCSGIRSPETLRKWDAMLKKFLTEACLDVFQGTYKERAQQFVDQTKENQESTMGIVVAYTRKLRARTIRDKTDPTYLNPITVPNYIKPIKKLLEMNGLGLGWKRIYSMYPEHDNIQNSRGYTRKEIKTMLEHSPDISTDFIILASSSCGMRAGGWDNQTWGNVYPIYQEDDEYTIEPESDKAVIVCAAMRIYANTFAEYTTLISIEAWNKLQEYKKQWISKVGKKPKDSDSLIMGKSKPITTIAVQRRIEKILKKCGLRTPLTEGNRRHTIPATNGFRRYNNKIMMTTQRKRGTLSALVIKERLMGHGNLVKTDKNYFWTEVIEMIPEYLEAMPELMINDELRLAKKLEVEKIKNDKLSQTKEENVILKTRMNELEAKVERLTKYQTSHPS